MMDLSQTGNGSAVHIKCYVFSLLVSVSVVFFLFAVVVFLFCFILLLKCEVPVIFLYIHLVVFGGFFSVRCFFLVCYCCVIDFCCCKFSVVSCNVSQLAVFCFFLF